MVFRCVPEERRQYFKSALERKKRKDKKNGGISKIRQFRTPLTSAWLQCPPLSVSSSFLRTGKFRPLIFLSFFQRKEEERRLAPLFFRILCVSSGSLPYFQFRFSLRKWKKNEKKARDVLPPKDKVQTFSVERGNSIGIVFLLILHLTFVARNWLKIFILTDICRPLVLLQKVFVNLRYN